MQEFFRCDAGRNIAGEQQARVVAETMRAE
jgi:hypothetical protein